METYPMRKQNLPWDILVLKEIARKILSGRQFKRFRKHSIVMSRKKNIGRGYYGSWNNEIVIGTGIWDDYPWKRRYANGTHKRVIWVFVHELGHMVQFNDRRINKHKSHHNRTFSRLLERLEKNYNEKAMPHLGEIIRQCKKTESGFTSTSQNRTETTRLEKTNKKTIPYKLEKTRKLIKSWETKAKRAETYLKKLRRREKIYLNLLAKRQ